MSDLRRRDLVLALQLALDSPPMRSQRDQADALRVSVGTINEGLLRLRRCGLLDGDDTVRGTELAALIIHGVPYVFPGELGGTSMGVPTGPRAHPGRAESRAEAWVWPCDDGTPQPGRAVTPLYPGVEVVALFYPRLHQVLALVDVLRVPGNEHWRAACAADLRRYLEPKPRGQPAPTTSHAAITRIA